MTYGKRQSLDRVCEWCSISRATMLLLILLIPLWLGGCATAGRDFPTSAVEDIKVGETSRREIRQMFGPPWRVGMENGQRTWTYGKYHYSLFSETRTTDLLIRFDDTGTVASYAFNTTEHPETNPQAR